MSKKENKKTAPESEVLETQETQPVPEADLPEQDTPETQGGAPELEALQASLAEQEDKFLRLVAEFDNFRRRTQKEKEGVWADATASAVKALLPVYDNLERALKQDTADEAFKKGVEMTMNQLREVLKKLGVEEIPALGETFDPNVHNAVMHVEDESAGENTVVEVFQTGFKSGDKVVRFAMVKVAN